MKLCNLQRGKDVQLFQFICAWLDDTRFPSARNMWVVLEQILGSKVREFMTGLWKELKKCVVIERHIRCFTKPPARDYNHPRQDALPADCASRSTKQKGRRSKKARGQKKKASIK